ncbi:MAG: sugar phosphate isomerase/epimerase [Acidobacteriota bacterium]|nr:MAG: sugar phosphate isomerase/epimerase [Acidobacteriota bacterium]
MTMKGTNLTRVGRRDLLKGMGIASVLPAAGWGTLKAEAAASGTRNMQLSLAAYSVRRALTSGKMDLFGFIDWCAELGLEGTELTSYYFEEGFDSNYLRRLRNRAFRNGVTISGTAVRNDFCKPPGPEKDEEIAALIRWIDVASDLFAPHIRIFAGDVPEGADKADAIRWTADGIKAILGHAEKRGIFIGLENHGGITTLATDLLKICEAVGEHDWFGVNLDTGNFRMDPYAELKSVAHLAVNVQIKVEITQGEESVPTDMTKIRDLLVDTGYKGWVALEYEAETDPFEAVPRYIAEMKKLFRS